MTKGLVNRIIPFSSVDGPGNRTAIFFQGCNFNCKYCHNPETIKTCIACGKCVNICPHSAVELLNGAIKWDEDKCENCGLCLENCPNSCGPRTKYMSVDDVISEILKVKPFISGITVSGGECTLWRDFLVELFKNVKELGLSIFVDSNGSLDFSEDKEFVDLIDKVMLDIKSFDSKEHEMLTKRKNDMVLKNAKYLASIDKLFEIRTVIVPDLLDNENNVSKISKLLVSLDPKIRYKLIKYRPMGVRKNDVNSKTPTDEYMNYLKDIAIKNGCKEILIL